MRLVLSAAKVTPGSSFTLAGGVTYAHCDTHAGGTWTLQMKSRGGLWTNSDVNFTGTGIQKFDTNTGALCRFAGGATGARIYCTNVMGNG